jgi:uncharacterized membrane protein
MGGVYAPPAHQGGAYPGARNAFSPGDAVTFAWERIKADPGTTLATIIVGSIIPGAIFGVLYLVSSIFIGLMGAAAGGGVSSRRHGGSAAVDAMLPVIIGINGVAILVALVVALFLGAGIVNFSLKVARGQPYQFGDLFGGGKFFLSMFAAGLLIGIAVQIGMAFLVVPGVILSLGFSVAPWVIVDRGLGPIEGMKASWELTDGHKGTIFIFNLIAFGLSLAGVCACGVGTLVVVPILCIAHAYIYLKLSGQQVAQAGPAV